MRHRSPLDRRHRATGLFARVLTVVGLAAATVLVPSAAAHADPPGTSTNVHAYGKDGTAQITWTAPGGYTGGTGDMTKPWFYEITAYTGGVVFDSWRVWAQSGAAQSREWEGDALTNGTSYTFTVTAYSGPYNGPHDAGPESAASNVAMPFGAPTNVKAYGKDSTAQVTWTAPHGYTGGTSTYGAPWVYDVTAYQGGVAHDTWTVYAQSGAAQSWEWEGDALTNGTAYTFKVAGRTGPWEGLIHTGPQSSASSPVTPYGAATNVKAYGKDGEAQITWTAPGGYTGGTTSMTEPWLYEITAYAGGVEVDSHYTFASSGAAQSRDWDGVPLDNGTAYTFKVAPVTGEYNGPYYEGTKSSASNAATPFGAPTGLSAVASGGEVTLTWTAPNGYTGSIPADYSAPWLYEVSAFQGGVEVDSYFTFASSTAAQSRDWEGAALTPGLPYTFKVAGASGPWEGPQYISTRSAASNAVTP